MLQFSISTNDLKKIEHKNTTQKREKRKKCKKQRKNERKRDKKKQKFPLLTRSKSVYSRIKESSKKFH